MDRRGDPIYKGRLNVDWKMLGNHHSASTIIKFCSCKNHRRTWNPQRPFNEEQDIRMIAKTLSVNCLFVARNKVVTTQWRKWVTLWVIIISRWPRWVSRCNIHFRRSSFWMEIGLKQRLSRVKSQTKPRVGNGQWICKNRCLPSQINKKLRFKQSSIDVLRLILF